MKPLPIHLRTLSRLAEDIKSGETTPVDVTRHFLSRVEALEPILGAFRLTLPEQAKACARAATEQISAGSHLGPLHGIPMAVKDLFDVRGLPTAAGSPLLEKNMAQSDSRVVELLRKAGMLLMGKTNTVQFAYGGVGINHHHGTPKNPWHETPHVPGGSSSGSAVAVAAGMVPMALGTDTGGSVRIPAALCGITGLKTTVGRISRRGVRPLSWTMDSVGIMCRFVEDAALVYEQIQGFDPADESTLARPPEEVISAMKRGIKGMRVAIPEDLFRDDVDPEITDSVLEAVEVLRALGADLRYRPFPEAQEALELNREGLVIAAEAYAVNRELVDEHFEELDPVVAHRIKNGRDIKAADYLTNTFKWRDLRKKAACSLSDVEVVIVPTTPIPAFPIDEVDVDQESYKRFNLSYLRHCTLGNILDLCGLSIPCGFTSRGLPIGAMLYAAPFNEENLLRAGFAFQQATDWHMKQPPMCAAAPASGD